jgi:tRNA U34 2-thiouridine synthase MnmA/TrmU
LTKSQVREIAKKDGLSTASKRESMGICFVGKKRSFSTFLGMQMYFLTPNLRFKQLVDAYLPSKPGDIVTPAGDLLAQHSGLWNFTIGQNARIPGLPKRMFVCAKNKERNEIVVVDDP